MDPTLDFASPSFDPLKALYTSDLNPPYPVRPLDNLAAYDSLMSGRKRRATHPPAKNEPQRKIPKPVLPYENRKRFKTVFDRMEECAKDSPLQILHSCWTRRCVVRVVTRRAACIRGVCLGVLIAFDSHMNLALRDVYEEWAVRANQDYFKVLLGGEKTSASESRSSKRRKKKKEKARLDSLQRRFVEQFLIRGDNVVTVSKHTGAFPPWPNK